MQGKEKELFEQSDNVEGFLFINSVILFWGNFLTEFRNFYIRNGSGIAEYSISQSTLETIFNHFASNS